MSTTERSIAQRAPSSTHWVGRTRRSAVAYAKSRFPAASSRDSVIESRPAGPHIGAYETSYEVARGYGFEREIVRP